MPCIEELNYEILLGNSSYQECADFITGNFNEIHYVLPGYCIFDLHLIGVPPIPVGVDEGNIIFPYLKPCRGSFVLKVPGKNELQALRTAKKVAIKLDGLDYSIICWDGNICEKCPRKRALLEGYRIVQYFKKPNLSHKMIQLFVRSIEVFKKKS